MKCNRVVFSETKIIIDNDSKVISTVHRKREVITFSRSTDKPIRSLSWLKASSLVNFLTTIVSFFTGLP